MIKKPTEDRLFKYIQLDNGTELVAEVVCPPGKSYIELHTPFQIYSMPQSASGTYDRAMIMVEWIPYTNDEAICIEFDKVLVMTNLSMHMLEYYSKSILKRTAQLLRAAAGPDPFKKSKQHDELDDIRDILSGNLIDDPDKEDKLKAIEEFMDNMIGNPDRTIH